MKKPNKKRVNARKKRSRKKKRIKKFLCYPKYDLLNTCALQSDPVILEVVFPGDENRGHQAVKMLVNKSSLKNYKGLESYPKVWRIGTFDSGPNNDSVRYALDIGSGWGIYLDYFLRLLFSVENKQWIWSERFNPETEIGNTRIYSYKYGYLLSQLTAKVNKLAHTGKKEISCDK